jgi:hypothetical protein
LVRTRSFWTVLAAAGLLAARPARAWAYDFQLFAETVGQGYQLRAADDTLVNRRRLSQLLSLSIYNLGPRDAVGRPLAENQVYVEVAMRFEADFGDYPLLPAYTGRTSEREVGEARFELQYAYVGARDLGGVLDAKLGRQLEVDPFRYRLFDGLSLLAKTPFYVGIEAFGGLNVNGVSAVDSPIYRTDGVALGGNPMGSLAARQETAPEPTFGVAVRSIGYRDLVARVFYERTMSLTNTPQPGEPGIGVIEEDVGWSARGRLFGGRLIPWVALRYSLLFGRIADVQAGARLNLPRDQALQVEYVLSAPTYDGDSIWNVFGTEAFNDVRLGWDGLFKTLRTYARVFTRIFGDATTSRYVGVGGGLDGGISPGGVPGLESGASWGAAVGARIDRPRGHARLDAYYEDGYGGLVAGVDLAGQVRIVGDLRSGLIGEGRISFVHFRDDSRPLDAADSLGLQAGLRYSFIRGLTAHLLIEENVNRLQPSQLRLIGLVDLAYWLGPRSRGYLAERASSGAF